MILEILSRKGFVFGETKEGFKYILNLQEMMLKYSLKECEEVLIFCNEFNRIRNRDIKRGVV